MTDSGNDGGTTEQDDEVSSPTQSDAGLSFGDYAVLSPGVEIVLEGRAVSALASD